MPLGPLLHLSQPTPFEQKGRIAVLSDPLRHRLIQAPSGAQRVTVVPDPFLEPLPICQERLVRQLDFFLIGRQQASIRQARDDGPSRKLLKTKPSLRRPSLLVHLDQPEKDPPAGLFFLLGETS